MVNAELENGPLKHAVAAMERLPVLPERFMEIVEALEDENRGVEDVGRILAKDIGLTARLLQLVNSGFFGLRRQISDINEAVSFLGLDLIKSLVIALDTYSQYDPQKLAWFGLEKLWNHGLRTGTVARKIAQLEGAARHVQEDAFVGGMLHDVGKLILAANFPDDYGQVLQILKAGKLNGLEAELKVFGTTHATVAGYLLGLWGLPVPVVESSFP